MNNWAEKQLIFQVLVWLPFSLQQLPHICPDTPQNLQKVEAVIYINGGTASDQALLENYCIWRSGFSSDVLSVIFKIGAEVTKPNGEVKCSEWDNGNCENTFKYACISHLVNDMCEFLCCLSINENTLESCIAQYNIADDVTKCLNGELPDIDPEKIALTNSAEARTKGVPTTDMEPYIFFNEIYTQCITLQAIKYWAVLICNMLDVDKFSQTDSCILALQNLYNLQSTAHLGATQPLAGISS